MGVAIQQVVGQQHGGRRRFVRRPGRIEPLAIGVRGDAVGLGLDRRDSLIGGSF